MDSSLFATLAEPNRLDIVQLLHKSPRSVNEIVFKLKLNQPQVSKHLKVLADAGMVEITPIKNQRLYSLKAEPFKKLDAWLEEYRDMWDKRFDRLEKLLEKEKRKLLK